MRSISEFEGIFLHRNPVDMRKGINGLCDIVTSADMGNIMGNNLFVFCGKKKNSIKILYFNRSGFALWQMRLDRQKFIWPKKLNTDVVVFTNEQLEWLLAGYDVLKMRPFAELQYTKFC
jgi:transposase